MIRLVGCAAALTLSLGAVPAQAQATRTFVSGTGDDANPCSQTSPCATFATALSRTSINGEINCLDPGGIWRRHDHQIHHHRLHEQICVDPRRRRQRHHGEHPGERERSAPLGAHPRTEHQRHRRLRDGRHAHRPQRHPRGGSNVGVRRGHRDRRILAARNPGPDQCQSQPLARPRADPQHRRLGRHLVDQRRPGRRIVRQGCGSTTCRPGWRSWARCAPTCAT